MCCWTAVCWNRAGYMQLCSVCVLAEVALGKYESAPNCAYCRAVYCNSNSDGKTQQ
jgi:hypothetical protein